MNPRITKKLSQPIINEEPNETDAITNEKKGIRIKSKASIINYCAYLYQLFRYSNYIKTFVNFNNL